MSLMVMARKKGLYCCFHLRINMKNQAMMRTIKKTTDCGTTMAATNVPLLPLDTTLSSAGERV